MKNFVWLSLTRALLICVLFSITTSIGYSAESGITAKKIVFLGDSLTEGLGVAKEAAFPSLIEQKIKAAGKPWIVINAGISGSTTASAPGRLKWMFKSKPDMILLILGANDGLRGIKVEESKKNLATAIEMIKKEKIRVVLCGLYMPPNYGQDYTTQFQKMFKDLSTQFKIPLIPFILKNVAGDSKLNQADGIHPNEEGHKIIAETIYQDIKGLL